MARRTARGIVSAIIRRTDGKVSPGEIMDALVTANKRILKLYRWPWLSTEFNIPVKGTYNTGTISVTDGSATVTGTGTTWDTTWLFKRIFFGSNTDYLISAVNSPTSLTLVQVISTGKNWTSVPYTIYQDLYTMPADYEPGSDVLIVNPRVRYRLLKLPRFTLESRTTTLGVFFSNFQDCFCDAGIDPTTQVYTMRFSPPPSTTTEYKLIYRRRPTDATLLVDTLNVPESYDECLEYMTEYIVKRGRGLPGWSEAKQEAYQIVQNMKKEIQTSISDVFSVYQAWPYAPNASMFGGGVVISQPVG